MDFAQHRRPVRGGLRTLLSTRQGTITVAVISAVIAAAILAYAMHRYRQSVDANSKPETVFVANTIIQKGTSGDAVATEQLFTRSRILAKQASGGVIADASVLHGKVAIATIYPGQQITVSDFAVGGGITSQLAANQRAISVQVDAAHGLTGQLSAGDHVDVYTDWGGRLLRLLIPNAGVLGVSNANGGVGNTSTGSSSNVILQVDDRQAGELAFASDNGKIWLTLRPGNGSATPPAVITSSSILAETPAAPTARSGG